MNQKKAFSYLVWFLYSISLCICLLRIAGILSERAGYSPIVGYGIAGLWLILTGLLVLVVSVLTRRLPVKKAGSKRSALVAEGLVVVLLFAVGCFLRACGMTDAGSGTAYFELAKVAEGQTVPAQMQGAVSVYLYLLHFVFWLFGNHFVAGIWLQIVLQMIAGFFFYRAVRKLSGVAASLVTLGFVMLGPLMVSQSLVLSPEMLFLAMYAIVLYLCVCCICGGKRRWFCLLAGVAVSAVCYLDIMGISLLLMMLVGLLLVRGGEEALSGRFVCAALCILGCGGGFALFLLARSLISGQAFGEVFFTWWRLFCPTGFALPGMLDVYNPSIEMLCLLLVMALGIFSFWCCYEEERLSIWSCTAGLLLLIQSFGMTTNELDGQLLLYIFFAVLSGCGAASVLSPLEEREEEKEEPAEKDVIPESKPKSVVIHVPSKEAEAPKVKFIENPLPLPKKHVKKTLDYGLTESTDRDDFDFSVADDDDFDI